MSMMLIRSMLVALHQLHVDHYDTEHYVDRYGMLVSESLLIHVKKLSQCN